LFDLQNRLTRHFYWRALFLGLGVFVVSWFLTIQFDGSGWEQWYAFAASFGASAIWWAMLAYSAEREILALVRVQLKDDLAAAEAAWGEEVELLKGELERYSLGDELPAAIYAGKKNWDLRFNRDITADLGESETYVFRGPTGVYVGARLHCRQSSRPLASVEVTITDPTSKPAMQLAVRDRMRRPDHEDKAEDQVERELREDIFMAVIGLFDARKKARSIRIVHDRRATRVRAELFDEALYDSIVDTPEPKNFTKTLRWGRKQSTYRVREEVLRARGDVKNKITVRPETTEAQLRAHLESLGMDGHMLKELRDRYQDVYVLRLSNVLEHVSEFSDELDHG
jgi:hypothetical protein